MADLRGEPLRAWVRRQVAVWPAPIPIGEELPRRDADIATFAGERYRGTFGADGACVLALPVEFGLAESRHIDAAGVLRRRHFTGYDERIRAWSEAIGVPSR